MTNIINMTPHAVHIIGPDGDVLRTFEPSGNTIRLAMDTEHVREMDGVSITRTIYGEAEGLPEMEGGTYYIVSALVANALHRPDLLIPAEQVRDDKGRVVGCRSLGIVR